MLRRALPLSCLLSCLVAGAGCSDDDERLDRTPGRDAGTGTSDPDGGSPAGADGGGPTGDPDGGVDPSRDGGTVTPSDGVEVIEVGTHTTGPSGDTPPITFELPEEAVSFTIILRGAEEANFIVKTLEGPDGTLVTDDDSNVSQLERFLLGPFAAQFKSPNRVIQDVATAAALFPNNPNVQVGGGTYTMVASGIVISGQMGQAYQGDIDVTVLYRTRAVRSGSLDVTIYLTGAGGLSADSAPTDSLMQDALTELRAIYGQADITIGEVSYVDVLPQYSTIQISTDGSAGLLEEMFQETAGRGPGLHYFLVDRFEGGIPGGMVGGISGGLPGPPLAPGTHNSGVAVALSAAGGDPGVLAHIMAHEGGHWLGLFHTSEITGTEDQLPDTPAGMAGQNHLMYPAVGGGTTLSASQTAVMRHHIETVGD